LEYIYPKSKFNYYDQIPVNPFKKKSYFSRLNFGHARSIFGGFFQNNFHEKHHQNSGTMFYFNEFRINYFSFSMKTWWYPSNLDSRSSCRVVDHHYASLTAFVPCGRHPAMMFLAEVALGEETGFDDEDIPEPSSPQSVMEENGDDVGDPSQSDRRFRGLGALWSDCLDELGNDFISYSNLDDVKKDAAESNYSKVGSSSTYIHTFVRRIKGCLFKKKHRRLGNTGPFVSYVNGSHVHPSSEALSDQRGLSGDQKLIVEQAFAEDRKSSRDIIAYFRTKRSLSDESSKASFPPDPEISKLNNYIQAFKKRKSSKYNPTPNDLEEWCLGHGPSTVNAEDEGTFNTPFVLNYMLVRIIHLT
jgi:hypothetical protein